MLWFVFWDNVPVGAAIHGEFPMYSKFAGGTLAQGLGFALLGLVAAAVLCHLFYYLVPGMLGMKTGLPLYIVGTSTYGVTGGFLMPGFLMGLLQFGWLSVNAFFAGILLCAPLGYGPGSVPHGVVAAVWAIAAAFMGLKGIQYVARVATFLPLIPLAILLLLFCFTAPGLATFDAQQTVETGARLAVTLEDGSVAEPSIALSRWGVVALIMTYVIGFFATAGAAGTDFGMNNRDAKDVHLGGLVGITLATVFAGGLSLLIVAGAYGAGVISNQEPFMAPTALMAAVIPAKLAKLAPVFMYLLAIAAFPPACFSAFIAANSFKTTLPKVNPFISVGLGTGVAIALAVSGVAGKVIDVFNLVGASFGPICGAMAADYVLSGMKWAGPRKGFNPAGWISWIVGFVVGAASFIPPFAAWLGAKASLPAKIVESVSEIAGMVPVPPLSALVVGFLLYYILAKLGLESRVLEMPSASQKPGDQPTDDFKKDE